MGCTLIYKWHKHQILMKYSFNTSMLIPLPHIIKKFDHDASNWGDGIKLKRHDRPWSLEDLQAYYYWYTKGYKIDYVEIKIKNMACINHMINKKYRPVYMQHVLDSKNPGMYCQYFKILKSREPEYQTVIVKYDYYPADRITDPYHIVVP